MKIGLYFGTFNPIHVGHMIIANYMANSPELDEVWFVVSPHNPLKEKKTLLADYHRLALVRIAVEDNFKLRASDIEFGLPIPSYTNTTLAYLKEKHPEKEFSLIMGEDNLRTFHKWKNYEQILDNHKVYVYPRVTTAKEKGVETQVQHDNIVLCTGVPVMNVSASFIRNAIKEKREVKYLLTPAVEKYVDEMNFYR